MKKSIWNNTKYINNVIKESINKTDVLNKLDLVNHGGNYNTLTNYIRKNNIDTNHFKHYKTNIKVDKSIRYDNIHDILIENSPYTNVTSLKKRLYDEGLKKKECELCEQGEMWNGNKMSLILDHINGDKFDNRLNNLQIVCPNCNATLPTHCRGKRKPKETHNECLCGNKKKIKSKVCNTCNLKKITTKKHKCQECNKNLSKKRKTGLCVNCYNEKGRKRKVTRPPHNKLMEEIKESNYSAVGRKYGVSDNAIRKWVKKYENNI